MNEWINEGLKLNDWKNDYNCMNAWKWMNEWKRVNERMQMNEWICLKMKKMNELIKTCKNEWITEWTQRN